MKGLQKDDYWLMAFPVKNLKEGTRIAFEAAVGCSGSGARYYALEYSADGTNWFLAEGAETVTGVDGSTGPAHYTVMTRRFPTTRRLHAVGPAIPSPSKGVP